ncbi:ABC transporter ATP-binding protein [Halocatena marina]|uniref:ABC transporter ATP-binding protein n=1 Tax=Halocatena marina TaxID=2934937 RepID=A0ABD5YMM5_9EURY|nr:ABC transporter ATP-binding protein [Halocatena marina]
MSAIELESLRKQFDGVVALHEVNLTVEAGEVFGFLGPNGAGKSTTIDILLDYVRPTAGRASVFGYDAQRETKSVHQKIGVLPDAYHLEESLTARQHLVFAIESKSAADDPAVLLERVGLSSVADRDVGGFSKGMAQRLVLALALVGQPELLILDEPSTGLDPNGARMMRTIVREENNRGATVFFSSHILGQVEAVCDRVGILADGSLVALDSIEGLQAAVGAKSRIEMTLDRHPGPSIEAVRNLAGVADVSINSDHGTISVSCSSEQKAAVIDTIRSNGARVLDFKTSEVSLEELFASYTGGRS